MDFRTFGAILVTVAAKKKKGFNKGAERTDSFNPHRVSSDGAVGFIQFFASSRCASRAGWQRRCHGGMGREHIVLEVSEKGAEAEFDCAHGQVMQPIMLDKHGDFDVAGTLTPEHGGPVRRDENVMAAPARYSGHVDGHTMSLTVTLGKEKVGSFTLIRGSLPNLTKCR